MSNDDSGGLMSSAGLVRYFDAEDRNSIHIDPKTMVAWGVLFGVVVQMLNAFNLTGSGTSSTIMAGVVAAFVAITVGLATTAATKGEV
jgi:preprotein translocase subunit Sec61beta